MIYHIGHKLEGDNTEGDYPESLAGTKVTVEAGPWQEVDIPVEFPSVPIVPLMSLRDKDGNKYKVERKRPARNIIFSTASVRERTIWR